MRSIEILTSFLPILTTRVGRYEIRNWKPLINTDVVAASGWYTHSDVANRATVNISKGNVFIFLNNLKLLKLCFCCLQKDCSSGRPKGTRMHFFAFSVHVAHSITAQKPVCMKSLARIYKPLRDFTEIQKHRRQIQVSLTRQQLLCKKEGGGRWKGVLCCPTRRPCILQPKLHRHTFEGHVLNVETAERRGQKGRILPHRHHSCEENSSHSDPRQLPLLFFFTLSHLTCYLSPG